MIGKSRVKARTLNIVKIDFGECFDDVCYEQQRKPVPQPSTEP
jgi:hypothetical protein